MTLCGGDFDEGTFVGVTALADPGSTFTGWSGLRTVSLTLPSRARSALRAKRSVSATLTLVARTAAGEARTTARVKKLR